MIPLDEHLTRNWISSKETLLLSFSQKSNSPQRKKHFLSFPPDWFGEDVTFSGEISQQQSEPHRIVTLDSSDKKTGRTIVAGFLKSTAGSAD